MSAETNLIENIDKVYFSSVTPLDKIIGTFEGSFTAPPPPGGVQERTSHNFSTNISESTLFQGIYSIDGGVTWNDFNTQTYSGSSVDLVVFGISNANTFTVRADNYSFVGLVTYTVRYKVVLIAKPNQGDIDPQPNGSKTIFNSVFNYQKILKDEFTPVSIANGVNVTFPFSHSLGYIPKIRSFVEVSSSYGADLPAGLYETSLFAYEGFSIGAAFDASTDATSGVYLNESNAYVALNNQSGRGDFSGILFMRIYYDA